MAQDENEQPQGVGSDGGDLGQQGGGQLDVQSITDYAMEMVQDQARNHPWRTVGVAMGLGYVIGGGVPKFLVRLGLLAAGRVMADAITTEGLRTLSTNFIGQEGDEDQAQGGDKPRAKNGHHRKRGQGGERQARRA